MKTGFYNINILNTNILKEFFKDAVMLSYNTHIDKLDLNISHSRRSTQDYTIKDMIDNCNKDYYNFCIDRSIQYNDDYKGEVGYTIIGDKYFLYILLSLTNLKILVDKYNLTMK